MLKGQTALVTGAGRGIGAAVAQTLAQFGAATVIADLDAKSAERSAREVTAKGGDAWAFPLDVTDLAGCDALARKARETIGPISILINNAGTSGHADIDDPAVIAIWRRQLDVNLTATFNVTRAFLPALRETRGNIVNFASITAFNAVTSAYGYMASKAGVKLLTQTLAKELAQDGIRVNAVAPGVIDTEMTAKLRADPVVMENFRRRIPLRRTGKPEEVATAVLFLVSPLASYVTGVTLPVDGGFLAV